MAFYKNRRDRIRIEQGDAAARSYDSWVEMRRRVRNPVGRNECYQGVSICQRWGSFDEFFADMGQAPEGMSIDRIDSSKGYAPENCRWANDVLQSRNRPTWVKLNEATAKRICELYATGNYSQQKIADMYGVTRMMISYVVRGKNWVKEPLSVG